MGIFSTFIIQHIRSRQHKLAGQLTKALHNGNFSRLFARSQGRRIKQLRRPENRLGLSTPGLKHWALAAALGFVTFTTAAQQKAPQKELIPGKEQLEKNMRSLLRQGAILQKSSNQHARTTAEGELGFVKGQDVGDPAIGRLVFADLDGDGDLDFVQEGYFSFHQVFLNGGQENFTKGDVLSIEEFGYTERIVAGDLDGDGDIDLLGSSTYEDAVIYQNDGSGNFSPQPFGVSSRGRFASLADLDGDGDLDVVMAAYNEETNRYTASVFLNNGNAGFSAPRPVSGLRVGEILVTDVNGDDAPDLVLYSVRDDNTAYLQLMINDGSANFSNGSTVEGGGLVYAEPNLTAADVDGDGHQDLLAFTLDGLSIYTNNGQGQITFSNTIDIEAVSGSSFATGDLDGDGDMDLLMTSVVLNSNNSEDLEVVIATNNGSGNFTLETVSTPEFAYVENVTLADVDADGELDIALSNFAQARLYTNAGISSLGEGQPLPIFPSTSLSATFADLDNDGDIDAVGDGHGAIWLNEGGEFSFGGQLLQQVGLIRNLDAADINGDGYPDLIAVPYGDAPAQVLLNDGSASFTPHMSLEKPAGFDEVHQVRFGDLDGDGDQDMVMVLSGFLQGSGSTAAKLQSWLNDGSGAFTKNPDVDFTGAIGGIEVVDVDGDGRQDVVAAGNADFLVFKAGANGQFAAPDRLALPLGQLTYTSITQGDVDGDGDPDVLVSYAAEDDSASDEIRFFRNNGSGTFSYTNIPVETNYAIDVSLGDIDGDQDLDLVVVNYYGGTSFWLNKGDGTFDDMLLSLDELNTGGVYAALIDIDGDEDLDLWWGGYWQPVQVWNNTMNEPEVPTGLDDLQTAGISLYPNPTRQSVRLKWGEGHLGSQWAVEIFSTTGQRLLHKNIEASEATTEFSLDALPPGMYLLRMGNGSNLYMHRIIKQ